MADLVWDPRLITAERVYEIIAWHPVRFDLHRHIDTAGQADAVNGGAGVDFIEPVPTVLCVDCGQPIAHDGPGPDPTPFTLTELAVAILRHRVAAHEEALSGNRPAHP